MRIHTLLAESPRNSVINRIKKYYNKVKQYELKALTSMVTRTKMSDIQHYKNIFCALYCHV